MPFKSNFLIQVQAVKHTEITGFSVRHFFPVITVYCISLISIPFFLRFFLWRFKYRKFLHLHSLFQIFLLFFYHFMNFFKIPTCKFQIKIFSCGIVYSLFQFSQYIRISSMFYKMFRRKFYKNIIFNIIHFIIGKNILMSCTFRLIIINNESYETLHISFKRFRFNSYFYAELKSCTKTFV